MMSISLYASSADYWKAKAEANAKDAERYRWLRDNPWPAILEADIMLHRNARWDAEIDAAMAVTPNAEFSGAARRPPATPG
mgnify:CR=1 FL=1